MSSASKSSGMGHISPEAYLALIADAKSLPSSSASAATASSSTPSKLSLSSQHKRSSTDPASPLSAADKAAIHRAIEDLKQLQESTNAWFRKLDSLKQIYALPAHNGTLSDSTAMCDQLSGFAKEITWLEQEVARVEMENYELDKQIKSLQTAIEDSQTMVNNALETKRPKCSTATPFLVIFITLLALVLILVLVVESLFKGHSQRSFYWS